MVSTMNDEKLPSELYAMQRANGDVFAFDRQGRSRVPLFRSGNDAMIARLHTFEMLLFKPVALNARLFKQIVPEGSASDFDFWLVNEPSTNLNRGRVLHFARIVPAVDKVIKLKTDPDKSATEVAGVPNTSYSKVNASASWEEEGGRYSKCA